MSDPFGRNAGRVTIKNGKTSRGQRNILARAIRYADKVHAPYKAKIALLTAIIQESEAYNLSTASSDGYGSYGVLQGLERYHSRKNLMNPEYQFGVFLGQNKKYPKGFTGKGNAIQLAKTNMSAGDIAQAVEGSAYPDRYATTVGEAQRINKLYKTGGGYSPGGGTKVVKVATPTVASSGVQADQTKQALATLITQRQAVHGPVTSIMPKNTNA